MLFACVLWIFFATILSPEEIRANIYIDGIFYESVDLHDVKEAYELDLGTNTLLIEQGAISMIEASCPDHLCIRQGKIKNSLYPIICLPNKVAVEISDNSAFEADIISGR